MLLSSVVIAPFLAALLVALGSGRDRIAALRLGLVLSGGLAALGGSLALAPASSLQLAWFDLPGTQATLNWSLQADGISAWLVALVLGLGPVAILAASRSCGDRLRLFIAAILAVQGCLVGAFLAADLVLFYIFFEASLLPMLAIIGSFGDPVDRRRATLQFLIYTMAGSALFLVAIWYLVAATGTSSVAELPAAVAGLSAEARLCCFVAFCLAFAVKTPLVPFHGWQAPVYSACPPAGAVLLAGAMAKLGTFGFLRYVLPIFPVESAAWASVFITLGLIGVVGGALIALVQSDLKRLLAFSSLSHLGLIVVGIFSFQTAGLSGAVVQMVAHGLAAAALFVLIGSLEERFGSARLEDFGGLAGRWPALAVLLVLAALAAVALPGTAGFVGEIMLLQGTFMGLTERLGTTSGVLLTLVAGLALIFGAAYVLRLVQRVLYGPATREDSQAADLRRSEWWALAPVIGASLLLGLYATPIVAPANDAVMPIAAAFDEAESAADDEAVGTVEVDTATPEDQP